PCRHLGDPGEHGAFPVRLVRGRLHLFDPLLHRGLFLARKSLAPLFRCGALGGLLRVLHKTFPPVQVLSERPVRSMACSVEQSATGRAIRDVDTSWRDPLTPTALPASGSTTCAVQLFDLDHFSR